MKKCYPLILVLAMTFAACKKNNVTPNGNSADNNVTQNGNSANNNVTPNGNSANNMANKALVVGTWKWSAQYTYAQTLYILNPATTGVQETLQFNSNGSWSQTKNGGVANTGTYSFVNVTVPGPLMGGSTIPFFSIVNSLVTDTARYDNFNFNTGFIGSFKLTKDSLVFIGVNTIDTSSTDYLAERVYVR
jgi:hypothetical protein